MPASVDPAILRALSLDTSNASIASHGGSGFAATFRISSPATSFFVKTSSSPGAAVMFEGEHTSLNAIHQAVPSLCPKSFAWGQLDKGGYFLATEFLDLGGGFSRTRATSSGKGSGLTLAQKLAKLHSTPAPIPEGFKSPQYGFSVPTCCGDTAQSNTFTDDWAQFFAEQRLMSILEKGERNNGKDTDLRKVIERTVNEVVPKLLQKGHLGGDNGIKPVVVHGDLWSGNKSKGCFIGRDSSDENTISKNPNEAGPTEDVIFDPSAAFAHNEYDFGIMNMFGGFPSSFWKEYHSIVPKTEPINEYDDRVALYESYHHLNHYAIFGGSYKSGATSILKGLLRKYGDK